MSAPQFTVKRVGAKAALPQPKLLAKSQALKWRNQEVVRSDQHNERTTYVDWRNW